MLGTPTLCHTSVIYDDIGQKTRHNWFHSVCQQQPSLQKLGPLKILIGSCADLSVDSGSNLKYWLRLQPKMQTPAGVHSGTPLLDHLWLDRWNHSSVANWHIFMPILKFWHFLEVVGINIFDLAYLSNLASFRTTNFFYICKMLN